MSLQISDLHVSIENTPILRGINLTVERGQVHAIMGPNGSGKSTLAHTLAGHPAYTVESGNILLDGQEIVPLSPDERARAGLFLAFQYPVEVTGISVQNFLRALWEARFGPIKPTADSQKKVFAQPKDGATFSSVLAFREYLRVKARELSVPEHLLERNLNEGFSGGEKKRLEILQMAVFQPDYAVLDETDSGLDIDAVQAVAEGTHFLIEKYQMGVIVITHYQRILQFLHPDFIHVCIQGQIVRSGGPELANELEASGYKEYQETETA